LIDGYPSKYNSFTQRLHRWIRGDWQLLPWLGKRIINREGKKVVNPLSALDKWKILDNMRRSLIAPAFVLLVILGLFVLPGNSYVWVGLAVLSISISFFTTLIDTIILKNYKYVGCNN
jgi:hypothetical protein